MPPMESPPDWLNIPCLTENATDEEIREAWEALKQIKKTLSAEKSKQKQWARLLYLERESTKWRILEKSLGEIRRSDLDEEAGEEKSRESGKELAALKKGIIREEHLLRALG